MSHGPGLLLLVATLTVVQLPARTPDVLYVPTRHAVADAMLRLAGVGPDDVVYDLGSGDGRIPIIAAQKYGARGVGIELDPALVTLAERNAADALVGQRVRFIVGDLFKADLTEATVVTMYLSSNVLKQLEPGLRALRPGTRIVSHQFAFRTWAPDRRLRVDEAELLLWVVPGPQARQIRRDEAQFTGFGPRSRTSSGPQEINRWASSSTPSRSPPSSRFAT